MHRFVFVQQPLIGFTFCPKLHIIKFFFNLVFVKSLGEICGTLAILLLSVVRFAEIIFWYLYTNLHLKILLSKGATEIAPESLSSTVLFSENFCKKTKEA